MRRFLHCVSLSLAVLCLGGVSLLAWDGAPPSDDKKPAVVVIHLPAEAELVIDGFKSKQQTAVREFDTPPLTPGKKYSYVLKAAWKDGEREVTHEKTIVVASGETTEIDLLKPLPAPSKAERIVAPELKPEPKPESEKESKPEPKPEQQKKPKSEPVLEAEKIKTPPKTKPEKKPELQPEKKTEPEKKPDPKSELPLEKKPEPEAKPEIIPKPIEKSQLEPEKKPEPAPIPLKAPVEVPAPKGTLALGMPEILTLQPGATKLLPIKVTRKDCEGPVSVTFEGLPPGVELKNATIAAAKQKVYVQATAPADAEQKEWDVKVIGVLGTVRQESTLKIKIAK